MFRIVEPIDYTTPATIACCSFPPLSASQHQQPIPQTQLPATQLAVTLLNQPVVERIVQLPCKKKDPATKLPIPVSVPMTNVTFFVSQSTFPVTSSGGVNLSFWIKAKAEPLLDETFKVWAVNIDAFKEGPPELVIEYAWTDSMYTRREIALPAAKLSKIFKLTLEGPGVLQYVELTFKGGRGE